MLRQTFNAFHLRRRGLFNSFTRFADCWKCNCTNVVGSFCTACGVIQPPPFESDADFFSLLEVPKSYAIDEALVRRRYKELQAVFHPDKFARESDVERGHAADRSALLNAAHRTLLEPYDRGQHLLKIAGLAEDLEGKTESGGAMDDPDFLSIMMETNERLAECVTRDEMLAFQATHEAERAQLVDEIAVAFDEGKLLDAKRLLTKLKYFNSISNSVRDKLRSLL